MLDDTFIPTVLQRGAANRLATFTTELLGLLHQRGEALGGRVAATGRGAASEIADFLMLQAINRYEPLLAHFADAGVMHPEAVFPVLRGGGRRAGDIHDARRSGRRSSRATGTIDLQGDVRAGDRGAARVDEQGADAERDSDSARAAEVRHQRRDRPRPLAVQHRGIHPGGARRRVRRKNCGSGFRRR